MITRKGVAKFKEIIMRKGTTKIKKKATIQGEDHQEGATKTKKRVPI
jgi:hypothetical protein